MIVLPVASKKYFSVAQIILVILLWLPGSQLICQSSAWLKYDPITFDQDTCCWRKLAASQQYDEAAMLMEFFIKERPRHQTHALRWHLAQLYAFGGHQKQAIRYARSTYSIFYKWFGNEDAKSWYYFAKGTVAFFQRDQQTLHLILAKWKRQLPVNNNYRELERLSKHWTDPYQTATAYETN